MCQVKEIVVLFVGSVCLLIKVKCHFRMNINQPRFVCYGIDLSTLAYIQHEEDEVDEGTGGVKSELSNALELLMSTGHGISY